MCSCREMPGWDQAGFDAGGWRDVQLEPHGPEVAFQPYPSEPVVAIDSIRPISMSEPAPGAHVFDIGQNFAGVVSLRVRGWHVRCSAPVHVLILLHCRQPKGLVSYPPCSPILPLSLDST